MPTYAHFTKDNLDSGFHTMADSRFAMSATDLDRLNILTMISLRTSAPTCLNMFQARGGSCLALGVLWRSAR
jgi:hypothetical protein